MVAINDSKTSGRMVFARKKDQVVSIVLLSLLEIGVHEEGTQFDEAKSSEEIEARRWCRDYNFLTEAE